MIFEEQTYPKCPNDGCEEKELLETFISEGRFWASKVKCEKCETEYIFESDWKKLLRLEERNGKN